METGISSCIKFLANVKQLHNIRCIYTSPTTNLIQKWRKERGLPMNPNASGILTDRSDFTYLDGRPTPYGVRQRNRLIKQKEIAETIIRLSGEIDFAVERHQQMEMEKKDHVKQIIDSKLKPKGAALSKNSK